MMAARVLPEGTLCRGAQRGASPSATDCKGLAPERPGEAPQTPISTRQLCALLALTRPALDALRERGIAVHLGPGKYAMEPTITAYVQHLRGVASGRGGEEQVISLTAERARLAREQADAVAIKNEVARGELVPAVEVERVWGDVLRQVRARILAVPSRLRQSLTLSAVEVDAIDRELREALVELGNGD